MMLLVERGYAGFSASAVAERAGLSRMAMLYHFPTLADLLTALVRHVTERRIESFMAAIRAVPRIESYRGRDYRAAVVDIAWKQLETPEFTAFTELVAAARANASLATHMQPALAEFDASRRRISEALFPKGSVDQHDFQLARDIVRFLTEGVGHRTTIVENRAERIGRLQHFLRMLVATSEGNAFLELVSADWERQQRQKAGGG